MPVFTCILIQLQSCPCLTALIPATPIVCYYNQCVEGSVLSKIPICSSLHTPASISIESRLYSPGCSQCGKCQQSENLQTWNSSKLLFPLHYHQPLPKLPSHRFLHLSTVVKSVLESRLCRSWSGRTSLNFLLNWEVTHARCYLQQHVVEIKNLTYTAQRHFPLLPMCRIATNLCFQINTIHVSEPSSCRNLQSWF